MTITKNRYHQNDFTEVHYIQLLQLANENYPFVQYEEILTSKIGLVWRHDVDISPQRALKLAELEAAQGIQATYFFLLSSPYYNLMEPECRRIGQRILQLGHRLGLHFDPQPYQISSTSELEQHSLFEKKILETIFDITINVFSFHNPTPEILLYDALTYAGMINTYSLPFRQQIAYCSDSNGYWRHKRLEDVLRHHEEPRLQVLTHPEWWQQRAMLPRERVQRCLEGRSHTQMRSYDQSLAAMQRQNIGLNTKN